MTTNSTAGSPRFTNYLTGVIDADADADLRVFYRALRGYVSMLRMEHGLVSMSANPATPRLQIWVPLVRDLEKLLHQRNAVDQFRPVLGRLAFTILNSIIRRHFVISGDDIARLPLTGHLLQEMSLHMTAEQMRALRYSAFPDEQATQLARRLEGGNIGELYHQFVEETRKRRTAESQRMTNIYRKVRAALEPAEWILLRSRMMSVVSDQELDAAP